MRGRIKGGREREMRCMGVGDRGSEESEGDDKVLGPGRD